MLRYDLSSLSVLGTVGEPINPEAWLWYSRVVGGGRAAVVDTFWQTETGGHVITPLPGATPTKPGSAVSGNSRMPGSAVSSSSQMPGSVVSGSSRMPGSAVSGSSRMPGSVVAAECPAQWSVAAVKCQAQRSVARHRMSYSWADRSELLFWPSRFRVWFIYLNKLSSLLVSFLYLVTLLRLTVSCTSGYPTSTPV